MREKTFTNWWIFVEKTFVDCSLVLPKNTTPSNFAEKTFKNSLKTSKVSHYTGLVSWMYTCMCRISYRYQYLQVTLRMTETHW